jgi:hypothetical protein
LSPGGGGHGINVESKDVRVINERNLEGLAFESVWDGDGDEIGPRSAVTTSTWRDLANYGGT